VIEAFQGEKNINAPIHLKICKKKVMELMYNKKKRRKITFMHNLFNL
jgi:hypothetical protein